VTVHLCAATAAGILQKRRLIHSVTAGNFAAYSIVKVHQSGIFSGLCGTGVAS
jgi:hypothetical protein